MNTLKGPGIFLSQFIDNTAPFNTLEGLATWASSLGLKHYKYLVIISTSSILSRQLEASNIAMMSKACLLNTIYRSVSYRRIWKDSWWRFIQLTIILLVVLRLKVLRTIQ